MKDYKSELDELYNEELQSKNDYEYMIELSQLSIEDKEALQEMYFSKKDLQDPKTIKKIEDILNRTRYQNVAAIAAMIAFVVPIAISIVINPLLVPGGILAGITLVIAVIIRLYNWVETAPQKAFEKNYEKYKRQVKELKEKAEKQLAKKENSKYASKYKEIITNCDKVLKAIDEREKQISDNNYKAEIENAIYDYKKLIKFLEYPFDFGWEGESEMGNIFTTANMLKISAQQIQNKVKNTKFKSDEINLLDGIAKFYGVMDKRYNSIEDLIKEEEPDHEVNYLKFKSKMNMKVIELCSNDDNIDFIGQDGLIYQITTDREIYVIKSIFYNNKFNGGEFGKKALIEADKELGYYILSEAPEGLEKKKLPL
jgi:hypothetical protein